MKRTAVVTAGTAGIGLETALGLAAAGFSVTVVGRDAERGARAVDRINATGPARPSRFLSADLASLDDVRTLAGRISADHAASGQPLTVLVNNVGAMFPERRDLGGVEASFVVNHLSPYLLTELLLPTLTAGAPSRIVNVTSGAVGVAKRGFDAVEPPGGYYGFHWYGRAKLANLTYTLDLAARLDGTGVSVFAADPGGAATDMTDGTLTDPKIVSPALRLLWPLVRRRFARSTSGPASVAARPSIAAATDETLTGRTGVVIGPRARPVAPLRHAADPRAAEAVRRLSERHAPLTPP
ncbi:Rhamnolipids biosynthesis 3-oxoacyl-[acyl-carrier-protein] reductase [Streptomyces lavendulae subsp. lavendulae]|uniref:Rhamnolipids biosynthesis 3-oxoacyl-[acyl-carrier-protein] reductase n=1 Tax=Streptomyces lavendulae subsp. lavendulae TaxID=58340 RepID=A0A2K8P9B1_STRLA|nr:SDR family NAD(P)-dependent oxidoreductase [Streptomyces lavendulae]ATZ22343.1 Rhamnolipids biosynthesis 3-oxoacyl-[acyl-carrier-protein] reductase [Streptomyces lavendulae subsp. lavendulae]QUQ52187.1 Rhamnolipids biosynthesis 3-oxoacyl-[acyl-carrier-protein] reductase [Streptomyces lavendulae subsp. lavendulae]